jgi:hypothetical protein
MVDRREMRSRARIMRREPTLAERRLWNGEILDNLDGVGETILLKMGRR